MPLSTLTNSLKSKKEGAILYALESECCKRLEDENLSGRDFAAISKTLLSVLDRIAPIEAKQARKRVKTPLSQTVHKHTHLHAVGE